MKITEFASTTLMLIVTQVDGMNAEVHEAAKEIDRRYGEGAVDRHADHCQLWRASHADMLEDINENWEAVEKVLRGE